MCLHRAIAEGNADWECRIRAAFDALSQVPERDPSDFSRLNAAWTSAHDLFHRALVGACDSPWLLNLREMLYAQSERYRQLSAPLIGFKRDAGAEHSQIMHAAMARSADLAASLMSAHLQR